MVAVCSFTTTTNNNFIPKKSHKSLLNYTQLNSIHNTFIITIKITMLSQIRASLSRSTPRFTSVRGFKSCAPSLIQVGDSIPSVSSLREGSPGNEVDLADLTKSVCKFLLYFYYLIEFFSN